MKKQLLQAISLMSQHTSKGQTLTIIQIKERVLSVRLMTGEIAKNNIVMHKSLSIWEKKKATGRQPVFLLLHFSVLCLLVKKSPG